MPGALSSARVLFWGCAPGFSGQHRVHSCWRIPPRVRRGSLLAYSGRFSTWAVSLAQRCHSVKTSTPRSVGAAVALAVVTSHSVGNSHADRRHPLQTNAGKHYAHPASMMTIGLMCCVMIVGKGTYVSGFFDIIERLEQGIHTFLCCVASDWLFGPHAHRRLHPIDYGRSEQDDSCRRDQGDDSSSSIVENGVQRPVDRLTNGSLHHLAVSYVLRE